MWPSSLVHATPTFSVWLQLCEPQGKCWQSKSSSSSPEHWTLTRAILAGDEPKCALEDGKEGKEAGNQRKKEREGGRRERTKISISTPQNICKQSTFQPAVAPDGCLKSQHSTHNGGLLIPKAVITHTAPLTSSSVEDFHCTFIDAIGPIHIQTNWVRVVDGGNCVCVCVFECVRVWVHVYTVQMLFGTLICYSLVPGFWVTLQPMTQGMGTVWNVNNNLGTVLILCRSGNKIIISILTLAADTCVLIVATVMEVESVVWTVGDVRPQLPALHIVQHNGTGAPAKVGVTVCHCSCGQEPQLPTHYL